MPAKKTFRLGELQLRILKVLWSRTEASVTEVIENLPGRDDPAYTTIATMLRKMEARGLVTHRSEGRSFLYKAAVKEPDVTQNMADQLIDRFFAGSLTEAVNHLLTTRDVSAAELKELEQLIARKKKS